MVGGAAVSHFDSYCSRFGNCSYSSCNGGSAFGGFKRLNSICCNIQGRFSSSVLDEKYLLAVVRYVELNPVRAGMVACAWDHPCSSAAFHTGRSDSDPLVKDKTLSGLITNWEEYLAGGTTLELTQIRIATQTGRPAGDDSFVGKVANLTGRDLSIGKAGRPKKQ